MLPVGTCTGSGVFLNIIKLSIASFPSIKTFPSSLIVKSIVVSLSSYPFGAIVSLSI